MAAAAAVTMAAKAGEARYSVRISGVLMDEALAAV
jgi:hypothetical protein